MFSQTFSRDLGYRMPADDDLPAVDIIKSHKQIYQSAFAATSWPNNCHFLTFFDVQIQILNEFSIRRVRKIYIFENHFACATLYLWQPCIADFVLHVQNVENSDRGSLSGLQVGKNIGNVVERLGKFVCVREEGGNLTDFHDVSVLQCENAAHDCHN